MHGKSHIHIDRTSVMHTTYIMDTILRMISYIIESMFSACKRWNIIAVNLHLNDDGDCRLVVGRRCLLFTKI